MFSHICYTCYMSRSCVIWPSKVALSVCVYIYICVFALKLIGIFWSFELSFSFIFLTLFNQGWFLVLSFIYLFIYYYFFIAYVFTLHLHENCFCAPRYLSIPSQYSAKIFLSIYLLDSCADLLRSFQHIS